MRVLTPLLPFLSRIRGAIPGCCRLNLPLNSKLRQKQDMSSAYLSSLIPAARSRLAIWSGSEGRLSPAAPGACLTTIAIWRGKAPLILPSRHIHTCIRTSRRIPINLIHAIHSIRGSFPFRQVLDDSCQFLLQDFDALLNHNIRVQIPSAFHLEVKSRRLSIIVKMIARLRWIFPLSVFTFGPVPRVSVSAAKYMAMHRRTIL